jgi:hypothetical protein
MVLFKKPKKEGINCHNPRLEDREALKDAKITFLYVKYDSET